jgi:hypothetical protein
VGDGGPGAAAGDPLAAVGDAGAIAQTGPGLIAPAMMRRMDASTTWRAALLQALILSATALVLATALDREFFVRWGWLAGPGAWAASALATGTLLRLPPAAVLAGAALAGIPSLLTVLIGVHWLGAPFGVAVFAVWCGRLAAQRPPTVAPA